MSTTTTNFGLIKPELTDVADITAMNENWDTIDAELQNRATLDKNGKVPEDQLPDTTYIPVTSEVPEDSDIWIDPDDETVEEGHINDKNNPHNVTAEQVGAAPAGYGLGQTVLTLVSSLEELDNLLNTGWYRLHAVGTTLNGVAFNYAIVFVCMNGENGYQEIRPAATNCVLKRFRYNGSFGDWCCDNPPMALGVEYRTTEQHKGKAVYTQLVDIGYLPNATTKTVSCASFTELVDCHCTNSATYVATSLFVEDWLESFYISKSGVINLKTKTDVSEQTATVRIWFTKD